MGIVLSTLSKLFPKHLFNGILKQPEIFILNINLAFFFFFIKIVEITEDCFL